MVKSFINIIKSKWIKHFITVIFVLFVSNCWGQTIVSDGFNNTSTLFSNTGSTYYTGNSAGGDRPATSPFASEGSHGIGVSNGTAVLTSSLVNTTSCTTPQLSFKLASFSIGSTGNGADVGDYVRVEISPDNGTTYYNTLEVYGNTNAYWAYSATGIASTAYDGNATAVTFTPAAGGSRTTDGYSTLTITGLPSVASLRVKITMFNTNTANERWVIDNFILSGSCSSCTAPTATLGTTSQTLCSSTATSFSVGTDAGAAATYTWQASISGSAGTWTNVVNGTPTGASYSGVNAAILSYTTGTTGLNYYYQCVVTNTTAACTASSNTNSVTVRQAPSITSSSSSQTLCTGSTGSFTVAASGTSPTYQWQQNSGSGYVNISAAGSNPTFAGYTTSSLSIASPTAASNYSYQCVVSVNSCSSVTTTPVVLTVVAAPAAPASPTVATSNPACNNATVSANGAPPSNVTWYWETSGTASVTTNSAATPTVMNASGTQWIRAKSDLAACWSPTAAVTVTVNTGISISSCPSSSVVCEGAGTTVKFTVNASGGSPYTNAWQVNSGSGYSTITDNASYTGSAAQTLTINTTALSAGVYSVQPLVINACGTASCVTTLTVVAIPAAPPTPTASSNPACTPLILNAMTSTVTGVSWFWEGTNGPAPAGVSTSSPTTSNYSVTTTNTYLQTQTIWVRAQTNGSGCWSATSNSISATVKNTMSITTQPTSTAVVPGAGVSFTCAVSQPTSTAYQWQQNCGSGWGNITNGGIYTGVTSNELTINPVSDALNTCQYRCITTGACNTLTSSIATLTVANSSCFTDDFSTTLFHWNSTTNWTVSSGELRHNYGTSSAGTDYIYHDLGNQDLSVCDYEWNFCVKTNYPVSGSNSFSYYLISKSLNLASATSALDGYAVGVNQTSTNDILYLYRVDNGVYTTIITSTFDAQVNDNTKYCIKVTRSAAGAWEFFINASSIGTTTETTYTSGQYTGAYLEYSSTGIRNQFWVDDISICSSCSTSSNTIATGTTSATIYNLPDCITGVIGTVDFTSVGTFSTGNVYSVQLSNSSGSFAAPITISTTTSTSNSGTVTFTIPAGTAAGTNYKVRVVSNNPTIIGSASAVFSITTDCAPPAANYCPYISAALINGCGGSCSTEGSNEAVFLNSGSYSITVNNTDFKLTYDGTNFTGSFESSSATLNAVVDNMNSNSSCTTTPIFVGVLSGGTIPANSSIMLLNNNSCFDNNWDAFCGSAPIYVIISTDADWAGSNSSSTGWFSNNASAGETRVFSTNFTSLSATCTAVNYTYEPDVLPNGDGASAAFASTGGYATDYYAGSADCNVPVAVLPIELIDFYGVYDDGGNELVWKVVEEVNISNYFIEKSRDGFNFFPFAMIPVNVNSHELKIYTNEDINPYNDITYYRLSTQEEGTIKHYKIIAVEEDNTKTWVYNYYQQNDDLVIEFKNVVPKNASLSFYDITGKKISEGNIEESITKIPIKDLSFGIYFVKITNPYKTQNFKIIISK